MPDITVAGLSIAFPFRPYDLQRQYMESVIQAIDGSQNAILESPTGTGKTFCLLCSTLAWLQKQRIERRMRKVSNLPTAKQTSDFADGGGAAAKSTGDAINREPRVIYATRTHSQVAQVMMELRKTEYASTCTVSVLGSRDQFCIHPQVKALPSNAAKTRVCQQKVKQKTCHYRNKLDDLMRSNPSMLASVIDIEDLQKGEFSSGQQCCPFYATREMLTKADLVFMPYNYLLDMSVRESVKLDLDNSIVIIDEAHNAVSTCEGAASFELSLTDIVVCIEEIDRVLQAQAADVFSPIDNNSTTVDPAALLSAKESLLALEKTLTTFNGPKGDDSVIPMAALVEVMRLCGISGATVFSIMSALESMLSQSAIEAESGGLSLPAYNARHAHTESVKKALGIIFYPGGMSLQNTAADVGPSPAELTRHHRLYRVCVSKPAARPEQFGWDEVQTSRPKARANDKIFHFFCLSPAGTMRSLAACGTRSIILTSGTLSPVDVLARELSINFPIQRSFTHIIQQEQVLSLVVPSDDAGVQWCSDFKSRGSVDYQHSLGRGIAGLLARIPQGVLVFFPSYSVMSQFIDTWAQCGVWQDMTRHKKCFVEEKQRTKFKKQLAEYFTYSANSSGGGAFFAVCRGKISEGVDFPDRCARAVLILGLPYPAWLDNRVQAKMKFLDETYSDTKLRTLRGREWYEREAWMTVNQAAGRVIRHCDDFGACLFLDNRFRSQLPTPDKRPKASARLPNWITERMAAAPLSSALVAVREFFHDKRKGLRVAPLPALQQRPAAGARSLRGDDGKKPRTVETTEPIKPINGALVKRNRVPEYFSPSNLRSRRVEAPAAAVAVELFNKRNDRLDKYKNIIAGSYKYGKDVKRAPGCGLAICPKDPAARVATVAPSASNSSMVASSSASSDLLRGSGGKSARRKLLPAIPENQSKIFAAPSENRAVAVDDETTLTKSTKASSAGPEAHEIPGNASRSARLAAIMPKGQRGVQLATALQMLNRAKKLSFDYRYASPNMTSFEQDQQERQQSAVRDIVRALESLVDDKHFPSMTKELRHYIPAGSVEIFDSFLRGVTYELEQKLARLKRNSKNRTLR